MTMKSSFAFSNLIGSTYTQGNLLFVPSEEAAFASSASNSDLSPSTSTTLLSPIGNRLTLISPLAQSSTTLPIQLPTRIARIASNPASPHLVLLADEKGRSILANSRTRAQLARIDFKQPLRDAQFSPDGKYLAITHGSQVQVWTCPNHRVREFAPWSLHRTYTGHFADVLSIKWNKSSRFFLTTSKDMTARLYSLNPESLPPVDGVPAKFRPKTFSGHRAPVLAAYWSADEREIFTVSRDGALFVWRGKEEGEEESSDEDDDDEDAEMEQAPNVDEPEGDGQEQERSNGHAAVKLAPVSKESVPHIAMTRWGILSRHYFNQTGTRVTCTAFHRSLSLLVVGFSSGVFALYELPAFVAVHTLSISSGAIESVSFDASGEWLAFGASAAGQLLIWEWRSESYILKQQAHASATAGSMGTLAYSADGTVIATGGDDGKLKLWSARSGFCMATFTQHSAPISSLVFAKQGSVLFSASLDGTVRAWDLIRYRNFRTFAAPRPVQFASLAVEPSGEVVAAGGADTFDVYMWSVQSGKILEVLAGHEGPVSSLAFSADGSGTLASTSWDKSLRLWEVFRRSANTEPMTLTSDGLALAIRPDGLEAAVATLDGQLSFFDVKNVSQSGVIDCRLDIAAGRSVDDKVSASASKASSHFTSVVYSADGRCVLAGGTSNWVCLYDVGERVLLRRWALSTDETLDGVRDKLDSRNLTEAGPVESLAISARADEDDLTPAQRADATLPGAQRGDLSRRSIRPAARTSCVSFSPTGREWAAATSSGVLLYSLDAAGTNAFDPTDLDVELTPQNVRRAASEGESLRALLGALRLGEGDRERRLASEVYEGVPPKEVQLLVRQLPVHHIPALLRLIVSRLDRAQSNGTTKARQLAATKAVGEEDAAEELVTIPSAGPSSISPHLEFHLLWISSILTYHGPLLRDGISARLPAAPTVSSEGENTASQIKMVQSTLPPQNIAPTLRLVAAALLALRDGVKKVTDENTHRVLVAWSHIT